jgi:hypothetical protein
MSWSCTRGVRLSCLSLLLLRCCSYSFSIWCALHITLIHKTIFIRTWCCEAFMQLFKSQYTIILLPTEIQKKLYFLEGSYTMSLLPIIWQLNGNKLTVFCLRHRAETLLKEAITQGMISIRVFDIRSIYKLLIIRLFVGFVRHKDISIFILLPEHQQGWR